MDMPCRLARGDASATDVIARKERKAALKVLKIISIRLDGRF